MENVLTQHIEITPGVRGGKARIANTRITVSDVAILHLKLGQSVDEIAAEYNLTLAEVHTALAYYYDHQVEIERQLEKDDEFVAAFRDQHPSKLQVKLTELRGER